MAKRPRGRPVLLPNESERVSIGFRTTPMIKMALMEAAATNGRSISQEAELRLELSFRDDRVVALLEDIRGRI